LREPEPEAKEEEEVEEEVEPEAMLAASMVEDSCCCGSSLSCWLGVDHEVSGSGVRDADRCLCEQLLRDRKLQAKGS
jgi:hypothetical protein